MGAALSLGETRGSFVINGEGELVDTLFGIDRYPSRFGIGSSVRPK